MHTLLRMELKKKDLYELFVYVATNDRERVIDEMTAFLDEHAESTNDNPLELFLLSREKKEK